MKPISFLLALMLAGSLQAGVREGHGGDAVEAESLLYSLDLDSFGIAVHPFFQSGVMTQDHPFDGQTLLPGFQLFSLYDIPCMPGEIGGCGDIWLVDTPDQQARRLFGDANPELFGAASGTLVNNNYLDQPDSMTVGLANKLYQIRTVVPEYADQMIAQFKLLTWIMTQSPVNPTDDLDSPIGGKGIYQIARNDNGIIRISHQGWDQYLYSHISPLDLPNRAALITHEILYAIALGQGDTNNARASQANAYLYMQRDAAGYIRKSFELMRKPSR
jgi:hypothetical protein